ncbi:PKD domain-containing protein [bacterium]|nr:PKD domain-containing protein [bacterium]
MKRACLLLLPALLLLALAAGCNDESKPVFTRVRVTPACGVAPLQVEAYGVVSGGNETGDPAGANNLLDMTWKFGDGGTGSTTVAYHRYDVPGEYTVTVTATDQDGNTASAQVPVVVMADSLVITATSSVPDGNVTVGQPITFALTAMSCDIDFPTVPGDSVKMAYRWEMGDAAATVFSGAGPTFSYGVAGEYDVTVAVTNPDLPASPRPPPPDPVAP